MFESKFFSRLAALSLLFSVTGLSAECAINPGFEGLNTAVKGFPVPATSPVQGVERLGIAQVEALRNDDRYVLVDVRPPAYFQACRIKGSQNFEYTFAGPEGEKLYKTEKRLNKSILEGWTSQGKTVVLFCNNAFGKKGCHRAANAAITAVCSWNLPGDRIKWFAEGVSGTAPKYPDLVEGELCQPPWHRK